MRCALITCYCWQTDSNQEKIDGFRLGVIGYCWLIAVNLFDLLEWPSAKAHPRQGVEDDRTRFGRH